MDVRVGGLDGPEEGVTGTLRHHLVVPQPRDLRGREGFDLALQMELVALLTGRRFAEESRLNAPGNPAKINIVKKLQLTFTAF